MKTVNHIFRLLRKNLLSQDGLCKGLSVRKKCKNCFNLYKNEKRKVARNLKKTLSAINNPLITTSNSEFYYKTRKFEIKVCSFSCSEVKKLSDLCNSCHREYERVSRNKRNANNKIKTHAIMKTPIKNLKSSFVSMQCSECVDNNIQNVQNLCLICKRKYWSVFKKKMENKTCKFGYSY